MRFEFMDFSPKNVFRLKNRDPRWYRDKYLTIVFTVFGIGAMAHFWQWPIPPADLRRGLGFLAVCGISFLLSPHRRFLAGTVLGLVALRGIVGGLLIGSPAALLVGTVAGFFSFSMLRRLNARSFPYHVEDYSYAELLLDTGVLLTVFWFIGAVL